MESLVSDFDSILSSFYGDQRKIMLLSSIFRQNVETFNISFDIAKDLPTYQDMQRFRVTSYLEKVNEKTLDYKLFLKIFKECLICLISMYEILNRKTFDCFVNEFL